MARKNTQKPHSGSITTTVHQPSEFQIRRFNYELNDHMPPPGAEYERKGAERYTVATGLAAMVPEIEEHSRLCGLVLSFEVNLQPKEGTDENFERFKSFGIDCEAFFLIQRSIPESFINRAFLENCYALLYGTMRGYAASMTASVQGGPIILPAIVMDPQLTKIEVDEIIQQLQSRLLKPVEEKPVPRKRRTPRKKTQD